MPCFLLSPNGATLLECPYERSATYIGKGISSRAHSDPGRCGGLRRARVLFLLSAATHCQYTTHSPVVVQFRPKSGKSGEIEKISDAALRLRELKFAQLAPSHRTFAGLCRQLEMEASELGEHLWDEYRRLRRAQGGATGDAAYSTKKRKRSI